MMGKNGEILNYKYILELYRKKIETGEITLEEISRLEGCQSESLRYNFRKLLSKGRIETLKRAIDKLDNNWKRAHPKLIIEYRAELMCLHLDSYIKLKINNDINGVEYIFRKSKSNIDSLLESQRLGS